MNKIYRLRTMNENTINNTESIIILILNNQYNEKLKIMSSE